MAGRARALTAFIILCVIMNISAAGAYASRTQGPVFTLIMDGLNLQKGVSGGFSISMINARGATVYGVDGLEDFDVLSQNQSSSTTIANGATTYQEEIYYVIMPKTEGQFTIKAYIEYNGQIYETNEMTVEVSETAGGGETPDLFLKTVVSHENAYLGEKIVVSYELYTRYNIDNFGFTEYISIDGAVVREIPENQLVTEYAYIDGERYVMYEAAKLIVDPVATGSFTIPPFNFVVNVSGRGQSGFGGFGGLFRSSTPMYMQTESRQINVKPLPEAGKPDNFSGVVGEVNLTGGYSRTELDYGDSLVLNATVSGGNLDALKGIAGDIPYFSVYETQRRFLESADENIYAAEKTFEIILVPEKTGETEIKPIEINFFNPMSGRYEYASLPGARINVRGDMPEPARLSAAPETVRIAQVSYGGTDAGYYNVRVKKTTGKIILAAFILLVLSIACALFFIRGVKNKDPLKQLFKQINKTRDARAAYDLFNEMVKRRYKISVKASSAETVKNRLPDARAAEKITDIMAYMESEEARTAGGRAGLKTRIKEAYRVMKPAKIDNAGASDYNGLR